MQKGIDMKKKKSIHLFGYGELSEQMAKQMDYYYGNVTGVYPGMKETRVIIKIKNKKYTINLKNGEITKLTEKEKLEKSRKFVAFNGKQPIGIVDTTSL